MFELFYDQLYLDSQMRAWSSFVYTNIIDEEQGLSTLYL